MRVLIVEDNPDIAEVFSMLVEMAGSECKVALDGSAGLDVAQSWGPDLVLCDLGLPGHVSGLDFARTCRDDAELKTTRLVAVTGSGSEDDRIAAEQAGFDRLVCKPVDFSVIEALCRGEF